MTEGNISKDYLDPKDVFIVDTGKQVFVWVGSGTSAGEKQNAMPYAHVSKVAVVESIDCSKPVYPIRNIS